MDISFVVAGLLLNALHFPDGKGAELELGIRAVMKRRKENRASTRSHFVISRSLASIPPGLPVCRTLHPGSSLQIGWFVPRYACPEYEVLYYTCYYSILIFCMGSSPQDRDYTRIYTQISRWCCTSRDLCSRENQNQQQQHSLQIFSLRT
jgi:hypothetical protein